jgi:hypothetical protein
MTALGSLPDKCECADIISGASYLDTPLKQGLAALGVSACGKQRQAKKDRCQKAQHGDFAKRAVRWIDG